MFRTMSNSQYSGENFEEESKHKILQFLWAFDKQIPPPHFLTYVEQLLIFVGCHERSHTALS